jgi:hypothetical protein
MSSPVDLRRILQPDVGDLAEFEVEDGLDQVSARGPVGEPVELPACLKISSVKKQLKAARICVKDEREDVVSKGLSQRSRVL